MIRKMTEQRQRLLHHLGIAAGFLFLVGWFYLGRQSGFLDWAVAKSPPSHAGAVLMVAIMVMMTPAFLIWKYLNRLLERRLKITGRYYEDDVYEKPPSKD